MRTHSRPISKGFTIIEIMIVVAVLGILVTVAVPGYKQAKQSSLNARVMNDLRVFANAFQLYNFEKGAYPPDSHNAVGKPAEMVDYLPDAWLHPPAGGFWGWDFQETNIDPVNPPNAVSYREPDFTDEQMWDFENRYDDGDPNTGKILVRFSGPYKRISYVIHD